MNNLRVAGLPNLRGAGLNAYGQVIDINYLANVLRQNTVAEDPSVGAGEAKHLDHVIQLAPGSLGSAAAIAGLNYATVFHESIHAVEEFNGETSTIFSSKDWSERNAYWMEFHWTTWVPRLHHLEHEIRAGRVNVARQRVTIIRRDYAAGVGGVNPGYPQPDAAGMTILRNAGFTFDLEAAIREIQRRTGVTL
jgi:hypothetical protein